MRKILIVKIAVLMEAVVIVLLSLVCLQAFSRVYELEHSVQTLANETLLMGSNQTAQFTFINSSSDRISELVVETTQIRDAVFKGGVIVPGGRTTVQVHGKYPFDIRVTGQYENGTEFADALEDLTLPPGSTMNLVIDGGRLQFR